MSKITYQQYELFLSLRVHSMALTNKLYSLYLNESDFNKKQKIFRVWARSNDRTLRRAVAFSNALDAMTIQDQQQNTGDSVRHSASASVAVECDGSIGQGGNQTPKQKHKKTYKNGCPVCSDIGFNRDSICRTCGYMVSKISKQQCKNHSVNELFCCCDDCTSSFIPPLYSVQYLECVS